MTDTEGQSWVSFQDAVAERIGRLRAPATPGQLRRFLRSSFDRPLSDFARAAEELHVAGRVVKHPAERGRRACRYGRPAAESGLLPPASTARLQPPPAAPKPTARPRLLGPDLERALVSRMVRIDPDFALGRWLPIAELGPHVVDLLLPGESLEETLLSFSSRFEFRFPGLSQISG